jgi:hypothetical protein
MSLQFAISLIFLSQFTVVADSVSILSLALLLPSQRRYIIGARSVTLRRGVVADSVSISPSRSSSPVNR